MFKNILLPIDIDDKNCWKLAIPAAVKFASQSPGAVINIFSVVQNYGFGVMEEYFPKGWSKKIIKKTQDTLEQIMRENMSDAVSYKIIVEKGVVYQAIIDKAKEIDADLILMVAHHPDRSDYLLGPNAAKVVRHSDISVLVLRDHK